MWSVDFYLRDQPTYSWVILLMFPKESLSRLEMSLSCRLRIFRLPSPENKESMANKSKKFYGVRKRMKNGLFVSPIYL